MAVSFGRGGAGSGAGGVANVGFAQNKQSSTAEQLTFGSFDNLMTDTNNSDFHTPSFRLTAKDSALGSINFGCNIRSTLSGNSTGDLEYQLKIQVRQSTSADSGFTDNWVDAPLLDSQAVVVQDLQHYTSETTIDKTLSGEIPFALSVLPSTILDGRYIQFRFVVRVSGSNTPTGIAATRGHIAFTSFGVGATSVDVGPDTLGLSEGAGEANKFIKYNTDGTGFASQSGIAGTDIATGAITAGKLATSAVTTGKIQDAAITADKIGAGQVMTTELADNSVSGDKIQGSAVSGPKISDNAITPAKLSGISSTDSNQLVGVSADGNSLAAVSPSSLQTGVADGAITTDKLADDALTPDKMAGITTGSGAGGYAIALNAAGTAFESKEFPSGGGSGEVADGSITAAKLASDAVTQAKIADSAVGSDQIEDLAVGTDQLAGDALTPAKMAGITRGSSAGGYAIALNSTGTAFESKAFPSGGGGGGTPDDNSVSTAKIQDDAVTNAKINSGAVDTEQLASDSVTQAKIADGAVGENQIASTAVTNAKIANDAITPPQVDGISTGASYANHYVVLDSTGSSFTTTSSGGGGGGGVPADDSITSAMLKSNIVTNAKMADDSVGAAELIDDSVGNAAMADDAIDTAQLADGAVDTDRLADDAVTPAKVAGITTGSGSGGYAIALNSAGTAFEAKEFPSAGGGSIPSDGSVTTAKLAADAVTNAKLADDAVETANIKDDAVTQAKIDNGAVGTDQIASGAVTDAKFSGVLSTTKGGTGFNASDISDLRNKLGIQSSTSSDTIPYSTNLATQKDGTMERVNSSTNTIPTGLADGVAIRINNDQWAIDLESGKQWKRTLTDTAGSWGTSTNVTLGTVSTIADLNGIPDGGARVMTSGNFRPQYTDGVYAAKVIVGRHGEHDDDHDDELIAMDRHNFWWAERPAADDTSITWHWEGTSIIPPGLYYTGGETDEEHIPVGSVAVLGGKTGIDGEEYINVMVGHAYDSSTQRSTYTGYWIDDDASATTKATTNTRGYAQGDWARVQMDTDGIEDGAIDAAKIDNDIIITDTTENEAVFLGIVPSLEDLTFSGYTLLLDQSPTQAGQVGWYASQRGLRIVHADGHDHIDKLLAEDVELQVIKDGSNYIRGVFDQITVVPGSGVTQARFRQEGLEVVGTLNANDTVEIKGHKAVFTKLDKIPTINIADDAITNAKVADNAIDTAQLASGAVETAKIADDALTPAKMAGITTGSGAGGYAIALNSAGTAFESKAFPSGGGGGTPADGSITTAKLDNAAVTTAKIADEAVQTHNIGLNSNVQMTGTYTATSGNPANDGEIRFVSSTSVRIRRKSADALWSVGQGVRAVDANGNERKFVVTSYTAHSSGMQLYTTTTAHDSGSGSFSTTGTVTLYRYVQGGGEVKSWNLDANAVFPNNLAGVTSTGSSDANKQVVMDSTGTGFTLATASGGTPADNSITSAMLQSNIVTNAKMADDSVGASELIDDSVGNAAMANDAINTAQIVNDAVTNAKIANNAVQSDQINADAVTGAKIADDAIGNEHIAANAVQSDQINADAVTGAKIADDAIGNEHIAANAVQTSQLNADAVTEAKLADNAVVPANIKGVTAGSGIASKVLAFDGSGTSFVAVDQSSGGGSSGGAELQISGGSSNSSYNQSIIKSNSSETEKTSQIFPFTYILDVVNRSANKVNINLGIDVRYSFQSAAGAETNSGAHLQVILQYRYTTNSSNTDWSSWIDADFFDGDNIIFARTLSGAGPQQRSETAKVNEKFDLDSIHSSAVDGRKIEFRFQMYSNWNAYNQFENTRFATSLTEDFCYLSIIDGGGSGGGSSTPADGSITTAKLASSAVTEAKIANDAIDPIGTKIGSVYTESSSTYAYSVTNQPTTIVDGQVTYTQSTGTGTIYANLTSTETLTPAIGSVLTLYQSDAIYRMIRVTNVATTSGVTSSTGTIIGGNGTLTNAATMRLLIGTVGGYDSVLKTLPSGRITTGAATPSSLGLAGAGAENGDLITIAGSGASFAATSPAEAGIIKATLMCKQEVTNSGEISVTASNTNDLRAPLQTQTGVWTVANRSTDWIRFSAGGLCYFGTPTAQPICADFAVLVRWANGAETMPTTWSTSNSRVKQVDLGSDRLMVVKLYAGNTAGTAHVDCAVGSGYKFTKLSDIDTAIVDGTRVEFTLGFAFQSPSPSYTARRFFLTGEVLDGSKVYANF